MTFTSALADVDSIGLSMQYRYIFLDEIAAAIVPLVSPMERIDRVEVCEAGLATDC